MKLSRKNIFLISLFIAPSLVSVQTVYRFIFWDSANGKLVKVLSTGDGSQGFRYLDVEYSVNGQKYRVESSIGTSEYLKKDRLEQDISILYKPSEPNEATIKYRYGQLAKLFFFWIFFGTVFVIAKISISQLQLKTKTL